MNLKSVESYVRNFLNVATVKREVKGIRNMDYSLEHSQKSDSFYINLRYPASGTTFTKQIRVSDHLLSRINHKSEFIVNNPQDSWDESTKNRFKKFLRREIEKFYQATSLLIIKSFTS